MDSRLMDKKVLCLLDTRQIQKFMFRSNTYEDALGGSDLITHILQDGIRFAVENIDPPLKTNEFDLSLDPDAPIPFFEDEGVLFQLMTCAAGNALFLARTGRLAQKIIRKISRYYLDHGYSLNLAAVAVEMTGDFDRDSFELYKKLDNVKASGMISDPLEALPVVIREERTGQPVIGRDAVRGDYISHASLIRRREAVNRGEIVSLKDLRATPGADGKQYRALLHVDGNNLGITIGRILQHTTDYQKSIRIRRRLNNSIADQFQGVMKRTLAQLRACYKEPGRADSDFAHEFQIIHNSGDDVNCMCSADLAFPFLDFFFDNLKNVSIGEIDGQPVPLYCCGGICFLTEEIDFHTAFMMAEECCANAKKTAKMEKNLRNGLAGSWIDFQICESAHFQELDMIREKSFVTDTNVNLALRPYCLDDAAKDEEYAYGKLRARVSALHGLERQYGMRSLNQLGEDYRLERIIYMERVSRLKEKGIDLEALLGAPFYRDENNNICATWYDALTVMPFIPDVPARSGKGGPHD